MNTATTTNSLAWASIFSATTSPPINTLAYYPPVNGVAIDATLMFMRMSTLFCPNCSEVFEGKIHKIKCVTCDYEYDGEVIVTKLVLLGEELFVPVLAGKCLRCGTHNMDRIAADGICPKCNDHVIVYLPVKKHEYTWMPYDSSVTTTPSLGQWTIGSPSSGTTWTSSYISSP